MVTNLPRHAYSIFERIPDLDDRISLYIAVNESGGKGSVARRRAYEAAKNNYAWFTSAFAVTYDPRPEGAKRLPFILYPFQIDFMDWIHTSRLEGKDGVAPKSRDMGITWATLSYIVHQWLFVDGFNALVGSRKEDLVDNGTRESLFGRMVYIIESLPGFLLPKGFSIRKHKRHLRLINPENGNEITGEATNRAFGRGGRYAIIVFDEAAFWESPAPLMEAWGASSESTRCRIAFSTPNRHDPQNFFYELYSQHVKNRYVMPWYLHPDKGPEWYERQEERLTSDELKYEVDISFEVADTIAVYPSWEKDVIRGHYPYVPGWELYTSWDFGIRDTSIIWWQRNPETGEIRMIDAYQNHDLPVEYYVPFITGTIPSEWRYSYNVQEQAKITEHGEWGQSINYGDPAGKQRSQSDGNSPIQTLERHGIYIHTNSKRNDLRNRRDATMRGIKNLYVNISRCAEVDDAMKNARFKRITSTETTSDQRKPVHDETSHYRSTVEFFFVNLPERRVNQQHQHQTVRRPRAYQTLERSNMIPSRLTQRYGY